MNNLTFPVHVGRPVSAMLTRVRCPKLLLSAPERLANVYSVAMRVSASDSIGVPMAEVAEVVIADGGDSLD